MLLGTVPKGYQVELEFETFDLEMQSNCWNDFIEVRDGASQKSGLNRKYCGHSLPPVMKSTSNKMYIRFVSDGSNQRKGFSAILFQRKSDECALKAHGCEQDCINTREGYKCACRLGYKLRYDQKTCELKCGGVIDASGGDGIIESPLFPEPYPANEDCIWEIVTRNPDRITLNFMHFELEGSKFFQEECDYDSVKILSKFRDGRLLQQEKFCSDRLPPSVTSKTNIMRIEFKSDEGVQKSGFSATYSTTTDQCAVNNGGCKQICRNTDDSFKCSCKSGFKLHANGVDCVSSCRHEITAPQGVINSPNFPQNYPKNTDCIWIFKAIHGHRPRLEFNIFELDTDYECMNDYVTVYIAVDPLNPHVSGNVWTLLPNTCGLNKPDPITSPSDDLYMSFKTDDSIQRKGFSLKHSTVCGGHFAATETAKYIYSHARLGDTFYDNNTDCEWNIKMDRLRRPIHLKFLEFDLEDGESCEFDWVEIYEYQYGQKWGKYGRFCKSNLNFEIVAYHRIKILFHTDDTYRGKGFSLSYAIASRTVIKEYRNKSARFTRLGDIDEEDLEIF